MALKIVPLNRLGSKNVNVVKKTKFRRNPCQKQSNLFTQCCNTKIVAYPGRDSFVLFKDNFAGKIEYQKK